VERLRAACGAPVSFQELRADGIEHPAILSYELELVGMPVARPHRWKAPGRFASAGLRIEESDAAPTLELGTPARARPHFAGTAHRAALVATSALIMALAAGTTLVLVDGPSARRVSVASARARAERSVVLHARPRPAARNSSVPGVVARAPSAGASAAQLQAEGHQLLGEARYAAAIGDLRAALAASDQSTARCEVPAGEMCLIYAYALYDLGRALLLDGDPRAALGVLSERLRIENQRVTVQEELELARTADAGGATAPTPAASPTRDWPLPRRMHAFWPPGARRLDRRAGG
jgi:hypothetical protein